MSGASATARRAALTCLCLLAILPRHAAAQTAPDLSDLVAQGEQINRAAGEAARPRADSDEGIGDAVDGEAGIYVLTINRIFQLSGAASVGWTDNPQRTSDDLGGSGYSDFALAAGLATRVGGAVDIGLSAQVGGREYYEDLGPSNRIVSATLSAGTPVIGPVYLGVVGFGGYNFDGSFENGIGFYGVSASLSAALPVAKGLAIRPGAGVTRQWSEVAENDSTAVSGSVDLLWSVAPDWNASARALASRRWYDNFYEDVTFVARRDWLYGGSVSLAWRPAPAITVVASAGYEKQDSTFFLSNYDAFDATFGIGLAFRF